MDTPSVTYAMENSLKRYGVDRWGAENVGVNDAGHLLYKAPSLPPVDLHEMAMFLEKRGIRTPFVVRFPSMIHGQMERLKKAFDASIKENAFVGDYTGVFPVKVNQRRAVIEAVLSAPKELGYGLEAGSKPELLMAMAREPHPTAPLLINGFKDREFMRMAYHAAELGHHVVVIIESIREVVRFGEVGREHNWRTRPDLGVRAKLYTKGSGRWQGSGGETSKFGLTTNEILEVVRRLKECDLVHHLVLLHFHIGSQITRIKRIKQAVREGARLYSALQAYAPQLRYLDLGGGLGVDYDGSRTSYPSSANYTIEEYASQVVFEVSAVIEETEAKPPTIVTESGRALVANHALCITDLREVQGELLQIPDKHEDEHRLIDALRDTLEHITAKNYEEYFHDAIDLRDEALELFSTGYLTIEDRASAEGLFQRVRIKTTKILESLSRPSEEITEYISTAQHKYLANFSIFQSLPDAWSIDHVFPAAPLSRHGERPTLMTQIVDITCDSDGCVNTFAHPDENLRFLPLHEPSDKAERYYLGFFMTGAYQDSLANDHNLFSRTHEIVVRSSIDPPALPGVERIPYNNVFLDVKIGATNEDALAAMGFDVESMLHEVRNRHRVAETTLGESWALGLLQSYPYLTRE
ncbi:MAG: biosynthetic arginine decarboxylase [Deltaproteobacteria bacterium]|nr:biosynthetic arginine decarboxylase [Deltaproteobacteria bacterium]